MKGAIYMPQQHFRHHRVAKKDLMPKKEGSTACLDYVTAHPIILWALFFLLISILKNLCCHRH